MLWLPIKSLYRFKSVSKTLKSLIASPKFIADYTKHHPQWQHLLIQYNYPRNRFVSIVDDDTFPEQKRFLTTPDSLNLDNLALVGSSHGLFCFVGRKDTNITSKVAVIWNPSINKSVPVYLHNVKKNGEFKDFFLAFGVCPNRHDPKIIKIREFNSNMEVKVFTLSSRTWRSPLSNDSMLRKNVNITSPNFNVVIDGLIYWLARVRFNMIVSFDLRREEFMKIQLPDDLKLSNRFHMDLQIFKLSESLAVVQHEKNVWQVWKMEINNGVTRSFTKFFNIDILPDSPDILEDLSVRDLYGFNKSGHLILKKNHSGHENSRDLVAYDPCTKSIKSLGINGSVVTSYAESILLLDCSESLIF